MTDSDTSHSAAANSAAEKHATDKRMTEAEVVAELRSGMTIGIGGWGSRRKPMSLVRAILRSDLEDLTVVSYGGPDIGLLCATGKVRKAIYGFVSLDSIPLEPHFRKARQSGAIEVMELDEGAFYLGLLAAAHRMPFYPTRAGLGSDMLAMNPEIKTIQSPYPTPPYETGETLVAMPALELDVALIHMNRADQSGNGQFLGPDLYFDDLFAMAASKTYLSAEKIIPTEAFRDEGSFHTLRISRIYVDGVVEAPEAPISPNARLIISETKPSNANTQLRRKTRKLGRPSNRNFWMRRATKHTLKQWRVRHD